MTNLYEYKHPIINNQLASDGEGNSPKKFPTLESWYSVINDYEFQARCPIILKNSHRNKHFTFACHLKGCPFKVLLSYSGNNSRNTVSPSINSNDNNPNNSGNPNNNLKHNNNNNNNNIFDSHVLDNEDHQKHHNKSDVVDDTDNLINVGKEDDEDEDDMDIHHHHNHHVDEDDSRKYGESDATDANVTAAIAAAVAAVQNPDIHDDDSKLKAETNKSNEFVFDTNSDDENSIKGPFVVTKIEPYHNHSLEDNMALDKFVLTKIPRILQHDLNFDQTLEDLYHRGNHSMNKFKVSQFVEDSGLLDIIKDRYNLVNEDLNKKFISLISRRVTTYKARFVLKKKKTGDYKNPNGETYQPPEDSNNNVKIHDDMLNVDGMANHHHHHHHEEDDDSNLHPELNETTHDNKQDSANQAVAAAAAAAAIINEPINLKRAMSEEDAEDIERYNKRTKHDIMKSVSIDDSSLVALDEIPDDKLPHDVAEQLRLLSSHFKEVESHAMQNSNDNDNDNDNGNDNNEQSNPSEQENGDSNNNNNVHDHNNSKENSITGDDKNNDSLIKNDDIPDENIQPELRGQ